MIDPERWAEARRLGREGWSRSAIARHLGMDRKTVREILGQERYPGLEQKTAPRASLLDPHRQRIARWLEEAPELTAVQIHHRLVREHGFKGQITIVRGLVRQLKARQREAFLRLTFLPGECAQIDWASMGTLRIGSTRRRLSAFVMVLAYSRLLYAELTLSEKMDAFLEAHVRAFQAVGGVVRRLLYDNCKTVVLERTATSIRFHPRLIDFSDHYGFSVRVCPPRKAWHKGRVESAIGYLRRSFQPGRRPPSDFHEESRALACWLEEVANQRVHRETRRKPSELFEEIERPALFPLPHRPYDTAHVQSVSADRYFRVPFDGNFYSVPHRFAHHRGLLLKATTTEVRIFGQAKLIASHERSYDRGRHVARDEHARGLIEKKKRAQKEMLLGQVVSLLGKEAEVYAAGLVRSAVRVHSHLRHLLRLAQIYGSEEVRQALHHALAYQAFGADYVENIIQQSRRRRKAPPAGPPIAVSDQDLMQIALPEPDLTHLQPGGEDEQKEEDESAEDDHAAS